MPARPEPSAFLLALVLAACAAEPPPAPGPWQRTDLFFERPRLETLEGETIPGPVRRLTVPLEGLGAWSEAPAPETWRPPSAPGVHALEQVAGTRLVARLELGAEPFLGFVPLPAGGPCACRLRIAVRGEAEPLWEAVLAPPEDGLRFAPETVRVELGAHAGETVELLFEVEAPPREAGARVFWGSPAVYGRGTAPAPARASGPPNVLLIGVDTLRADALGAYGRRPSPTPAIDRLAAESDLYLQAFATFNATNPSFTSILTGLYGKHHGVYDNRTRLADERRTLAQRFAAAGYATAAVLAARHLSYADLGRGFDEVVVPEESFAGELPVDMGMGWIAAQGRPFFLWLHLFDPHTPHTPPRPFALGYRPAASSGLGPAASWRPFREPGPRGWAELSVGGESALYAGEVAYVDRQLDRLLAFLESRGLLETTIVVFVADHGENLEDHGIRYGHAGLWDTTVHVPMMIRWPAAGGEAGGPAVTRGRRLEGLVQTLDLFPTLLAAAGLEVPPQDGLDLGELMAREPPGRPVVFAEHAHGTGAMVRTPRAKLIRALENPDVPPGLYLYDLRRDPEEARDLSAEEGELRAELETLLDAWLADRTEVSEGEAVELEAEELEQLRALGYL